MEFKPLDGVYGIMNAVIPVNKHFQLSCSYSRENAPWYVGSGENDLEVAIQVIDPDDSQFASLVDFKDNPSGNIFSHCNQNKVYLLIEKAKTLEYAGKIEVFDRFDGQKESEKKWGLRFYCAKGHDLMQKLGYCRGTWGKDGYRYIKRGGKNED